MFSFTKQSIHILWLGAAVLAAGVYYQTFAKQQLEVLKEKMSISMVESVQQWSQTIDFLWSKLTYHSERFLTILFVAVHTCQQIDILLYPFSCHFGICLRRTNLR